MSRIAAWLATVALAAVSVGANCNSTPPSTPAACAADGGAITCPQGQLRVCINQCRAVAEEGADCALDPCSTTVGAGVCSAGLSCVVDPTRDGVGRCAREGSGLLGRVTCDPALPAGPGNTCVQGTYCRATTCPDTSPLFSNFAGACAAPAREGQACDGDWSDTANAQSCSPCEPGATCLRNAGDNIGRCVRRCEQRSDCPCGNFECFSSGSPASNSASFCSTCAPSRASCLMAGGGGDQAPTTGPCCDKGGAVCNASTNFTCCRPRGTSCESNGQCCEGNVCFAGACGVCRSAGQSAANASQCCAGLELRNGVCSVRCPAMGASCTVPGQQGRCNRGTVTACNAFGAITCTSIGPMAETCNGQDDNCDGSIDNIAPRACTMPTRFETSSGTAVCNVGRPSAGVERCVAGASVCTAIEGFHFCSQAGTRSVEDPLNPGTFVTRDCGGGFGSACMCATAGGCGPSNPQATTCAPNLYCASSAQSGGGSPSCQLLPLCVGRTDLCWAPSTSSPATYTPLPACI